MHASAGTQINSDLTTPVDIPSPMGNDDVNDPESGFPIVPHSAATSIRSISSRTPDDRIALQPLQPPNEGTSSLPPNANYIKHKTSQVLKAVMDSDLVNLVTKKNQPQDAPIAPALSSLVEAYASSGIAAAIKADGDQLRREVVRSDNNGNGTTNGTGVVNNELPDVILETSMLRGRKRASWLTQFKILSGRAFKNLYRNPALLAAHYAAAIGLASTFLSQPGFLTSLDSNNTLRYPVICGLFYHNVTYVILENDVVYTLLIAMIFILQ